MVSDTSNETQFDAMRSFLNEADFRDKGDKAISHAHAAMKVILTSVAFEVSALTNPDSKDVVEKTTQSINSLDSNRSLYTYILDLIPEQEKIRKQIFTTVADNAMSVSAWVDSMFYNDTRGLLNLKKVIGV